MGLTAYDNDEENILDPSIAEIVFLAYEWGPDKNGVPQVTYTRIPTHSCTKEELGLEGDNSSFMPIV